MMAALKTGWNQQMARIDGLTLRERVILFLAVLSCCVALADTLWLAPAQLQYKQTRQRAAAQDTELSRLRDALRETSQPVDASKAVRDQIAAADTALDGLNQEIGTLAPSSPAGPALEQTLVQLLHHQDGLTLLSVNTLAQVTPAANPAPPGLARRGLELRVSGPYATLARYVRTLELALPTLRWGAMQLKSDKQGSELTLQVYVVGVQP